MTKTIIQIEKRTAELIKSFKLTKNESYDEIINRVFQVRY